MTYVGRTAPSASGPPHVGTLYSAWRVFERAKERDGTAWARIDDLDVARVRSSSIEDILFALRCIGYKQDNIVFQSETRPRYDHALQRLADLNVLYRCTCTRARIRALKHKIDEGGFAYDNACRHRLLRGAEWRSGEGVLRVILPQNPAQAYIDGRMQFVSNNVLGDPIVRRRDGTIAYALASVVDDIALGVSEIVRGQDLQGMVAQQVALFALLGAPPPAFLHHRLLVGADGKKWSKSKGDGRAWTREGVGSLLAEFVELENQSTRNDEHSNVLFFPPSPSATRFVSKPMAEMVP